MRTNVFKAIYEGGKEFCFLAKDYQEAYIYVKQLEEKKIDGKRDFNIAHVFEGVEIPQKVINRMVELREVLK